MTVSTSDQISFGSEQYHPLTESDGMAPAEIICEMVSPDFSPTSYCNVLSGTAV